MSIARRKRSVLRRLITTRPPRHVDRVSPEKAQCAALIAPYVPTSLKLSLSQPVSVGRNKRSALRRKAMRTARLLRAASVTYCAASSQAQTPRRPCRPSLAFRPRRRNALRLLRPTSLSNQSLHRQALYRLRYLANSFGYRFFISRLSLKSQPSPSAGRAIPW